MKIAIFALLLMGALGIAGYAADACCDDTQCCTGTSCCRR
jgi:hypothetical protein